MLEGAGQELALLAQQAPRVSLIRKQELLKPEVLLCAEQKSKAEGDHQPQRHGLASGIPV